MPARFYCPDPPRDGRLQLNPDESRHLTRVCRLGPGDRVEIFDGRGSFASAMVIAASTAGVELQIDGEIRAEAPPPFSLTLASAVPKGDRFDWLVEKATELGVDRLIPLVTERSVVDPRGSKLGRLRRSIVEASKQCRRARLMELAEPLEWSRLVNGFPTSTRFLADPEGRPSGQWPATPRGACVVLAVGPEGGLTPAEMELARLAGWLAIRLSVNTLRIETAGLAGSAALLTRVPENDE